MSEGLGTSFTIDITDLSAGLREADRLIRQNESAWMESASAMDDWSSSQKGIKGKIDSLGKTMEVQKEKVKALKKEQQRLISEGYDPLSPEVDKVTKRLSTAQNQLMKTQAESKKYNKALEDMKTKSKDVEKASKSAGDGFTVMKGAIAGVASSLITGLVSSIGSAVSSIFSLTEATKEYRTEMAKLEAVATEAGGSIDTIKDKWMETASVLDDPQAVTEGMNNLVTAGFTAEKELDAITKGLEGASIRWKDTLKFEGLADSLQEWIGSGGESLTGNFAEMLERMGYDLEEVTAQTKGMTDEQRKQWAITTLQNEGLNELSDTYREQNEDLIEYNKAQLKLEDSQARMAEKMQPFMTGIKTAWAGILTSVVDVVDGVAGATDDLIYNVGFMGGKIVSGIKTVIELATPIFREIVPKIVTLIEENLPSLISSGTSIISNILTGMGEKMPEVLTGLTNLLADILLTIANEAPNLLNASLAYMGGIVDAIPQIITTLGERLPEIITTIMDKLFNAENDSSFLNKAKEFLSKIVEAIPSTVQALLTELPKIISTILDSVGNALPDLLSAAEDLFNEIVEAIPSVITSLGQNLPQILGVILDKLIEFAPDVLSGAVDLLLNIVSAIPKALVDIAVALGGLVADMASEIVNRKDDILNAGKNLILGIVDGIKEAWSNIKKAVSDTVDKIVGWFKKDADIHSPSKLLAEEVGEFISAGIAVGMKDGEYYIMDEAGNIVDDTTAQLIRGYVDGLNGGRKEMQKATEDAVTDAVDKGKSGSKSEAEDAGDEAGNSWIQGFKNAIASGFSSIFTDVMSGEIEKASEDVDKLITNSLVTLVNNLAPEFAMLAQAVAPIFQEMLSGSFDVEAFTDDLVSFLDETITRLIDRLPELIEMVVDLMSQLMQKLVDHLPEWIEGLIKALPKIIDALGEAIGKLLGDFGKIGAGIMNALWEGLKTAWNNIWKWLDSIVNAVKNIFKGIGNAIAGFFSWLFGGGDSKTEETPDISGILNDPLHATQAELDEATAVLSNLGMSMEEINRLLKMESDTLNVGQAQSAGTVVVNQTNNYSQQHSRYEIWQSKNDTARAVKLAVQGV